jgi:putative transposase
MLDKALKPLSLRRQCQLLSICRATLFYCPIKPAKDKALLEEIHRIWEESPFYGYRKIAHELRRRGYSVNLKKIQRITRENGILAMTPRRRKNTSQPAPNPPQKFKFLLTNARIQRVNQVWSTDITYIKVGSGFLYLASLLDVYSRMIVGWNLSITMDMDLCLTTLERALQKGTPEIVNSDQGRQFTSNEWIRALQAKGLEISMDGKARWVDNVYVERLWRTIKQENVFLMDFQSVNEAKNEIGRFIEFYNNRRLHQNLGYQTPKEVYDDGTLGEAFVYAKRTQSGR